MELKLLKVINTEYVMSILLIGPGGIEICKSLKEIVIPDSLLIGPGGIEIYY